MDGDPRTRGEHQLEAPATQLAGQAVAVHQDGGRLLAALGELDPLDLLRIEVRRPVAHLQPKGAEGTRHEEAVAVTHHGAEARVAGGGPARPPARPPGPPAPPRPRWAARPARRALRLARARARVRRR